MYDEKTRDVKIGYALSKTPVEAHCPIWIYDTKQKLMILIFLSTLLRNRDERGRSEP
jgi:hypothetical protein